MSDEELIGRVVSGDRSALAELVERHHRLLLGYLFRMVGGNRPLAEDLVQETFVRVMRQHSYAEGRPFKPWLYAIATNLVRDHFRAPHSHKEEPLEASAHYVGDDAPGPEELALTAEESQAVASALQELSKEYRSALILRFYNGLTLQEIAEVSGVPLGTVKSRLSVGTQRLRALLVSDERNRTR